MSRNAFHRWDVGEEDPSGIPFYDRDFVGTRWAWEFDQQWRWICLAPFEPHQPEQFYWEPKAVTEVGFEGTPRMRAASAREAVDRAVGLAEWFLRQDPLPRGRWGGVGGEAYRGTLTRLVNEGCFRPSREDRCFWVVKRFFEEVRRLPRDVDDCANMCAHIVHGEAKYSDIRNALDMARMAKYLKSLGSGSVENYLLLIGVTNNKR